MLNAYKVNGGATHTSESGTAENGGAMDVVTADENEVGVSEQVKAELNATCKQLSAPRKQRKPSPQLLPKEDLMLFDQVEMYFPNKNNRAGFTAMALTTDNRVVAGDDHADIVVSDWTSKKVHCHLPGHRDTITSLGVSSDGRIIFSASRDQTVKFWRSNASGGYTERLSYGRHKSPVTGLALHPSDNYLVSTSAVGDWHFIDTERGQCLVSVPPKSGGLSYSKTTFHPDGLLLATGDTAGEIKIWDVREQKDAITLASASSTVSSLNASENGYYLAAGYANGTAKVWDLRKGTAVRSFELGNGAVNGVAFDYSGVYLAMIGGDTSSMVQIKTVKEWTNLTTITNLGDSGAALTGLAWAEHAQSLVVCGMDSGIHVLSKP